MLIVQGDAPRGWPMALLSGRREMRPGRPVTKEGPMAAPLHYPVPPRPQQRRRWRWSALRWWLAGLPVAGLAIQLIPYGHGQTNPPVGVEPAWSSAQARQ